MAGRTSPSTGDATRRTMLAGTAAALAAALTGCDSQPSAASRQSSDDAKAPVVTGHKPKGKDVIDVVADFGAKGDGRTDDSRAFARAYSYAAGRVWDHVGRTVIDIPAGTYLIRAPNALLNAQGGKLKANGLRFRGAGKRMTQLLFAPHQAENAYLCRNEDSWANVMFEQIGFAAATPGASFFYSYSTGQAQDYRFTECEWTGEWTYGVALDGSNTNSEMRWDACRVGGAYRKAFLYSGLSQKSLSRTQQDQFLNYWFNDMKVEYAWGNFLEFPYGGSITCRGGSYIVTGRRPEDSDDYGRTSTFFRFPRGPHHDSVQRFHAEDIRFEVRDPDTVVIDCAWDSGTVHFNDCDDTANAFKSFAEESSPHRYRVGAQGPLVRYDSCQLSGQHTYEPDGGSGPRARYDMCRLRNHSPQDFIKGAGDRVRFVDCLGA
ncbi:glycoside hydrolase family 55 protein [Streptomyces decoyicus]|uniref:Glycoside hydrolase family 55 protein n=1 Tax=Streptomyces decoyicus TaxID=249567 RepID=A0ABZ1FA60_9ACTN|nr:glycosyl hydrolase family 28-related protein [Streptomyces decoyicus]WSB66948.1 glycoside hydrolase family 55 protein [Streptomyces decoyicus]